MKKVRDLIEIPEVETVIQVSDLYSCDENDLKRRFVDTFVLTDDITGGLHAIFSSLSHENGSGFLLKGGYGSGKSHFIAFVASILLHPHFASKIPAIQHTLSSTIHGIEEKPVLPVYLTLTEFPATTGLSDIIIDAISDAMDSEKLRNPIADSAGLADDFARIMLPTLKDKFDTYCVQKNILRFDRLSELERNSVVMSFLKDCNIPFRPHYDYRALFSRINAIVTEKFSGGLFLLVDELSEFLRARSRPELISEDIRFIQFLGEQASRAPLRVLFSMQEAIEEVADISSEGLNRVKDRYPVRINLTAFHLRELVEKRLLIKKKNAFADIDGIHASLADSFPQLKISRNEFRAIYPIHPATFTMLESIAGLFSKTRGLVDFIVSEVAGDTKRSIAGILDEPANRLLLPDRIFDHFRNNLQESVQYNRMTSVIFDSAERAIPSHFQKENDASVALRAAKLIVLHQILPEKKAPSALEIANLIVENRFSIDPEINYTFIREKIMKGLEQIWPFLRCERGIAPIEDRFYLTGEESPLNQFEKAALQFLKTLTHADKQALWFFISRIRDDEIPLAEIKNGERTARLLFENTTREGLLFLKDPASFSAQEVDALKLKLARSEFDFAVILGFPLQEGADRERFRDLCASINPPFSDAVFYWKPRNPDEKELQSLRNHFARLRTAESGAIPLDDKSIRDRIEESKREAFRIIQSLYAEGQIFSFDDGSVKRSDLLFTTSFDKTVELFARDALKRSFPSHAKIMPTVPISSPETYHQIIMLFREKNEIDFNFEGSRLLKNAVDCILKGSGLLSILHSQYRIAPEPSKNTFIKDLLYAVEQASLPFEDLYYQFRKGRYGIQKELFCLYLFFLASSGYLTLKRGGKTLRPSSLDLRTIQSSDAILPGEELSTLFVEKYQLLGPFAEGLKPKNIHLQAQEAVWDKLVTFKRLEEDHIAGLLEQLKAVERFPLFSNNPLVTIRSSLESLASFIKRIKTGKSPRDGLNELLEDFPENIHIENDLAVVKRFEQFLNVSLEQVIFVYNYLTSTDLHLDDNEELKNELFDLIEKIKDIDSLITTGMTESLLERFTAFREEYKRHYAALHGRIHPPHALAEYEQLRLSPGYRVLANLSLIEAISVTDDIYSVERILGELDASLCKRNVAKELNEKPYCECRLRRVNISLSSQDIRSMILRGIEEYFSALQSKDFSEKIASFCGALLTSGDADKRDMLKALLEIDPAKTAETDMLRTVTREAAILCNRALSANYLVVEKNIEEFLRIITGRRGGRSDLIRIFSEWLDRDVPSGKEIVYHIASKSSAEQQPIIPAIALEALKRLVPGKSENVIIKALAIAQLPPSSTDDEPHPIIKQLLHIEISSGALLRYMQEQKDFIPHDTIWEQLFSSGERQELIATMRLDEKKTAQLAEIYNAAKGFPSLREEIIAMLVNDSIPIHKKDESLFFIDDSPHGNLLLSIFRFRAARKNFFKESAHRQEFNGPIFQWAFAAMREADLIQQISLNRNILTDRIAMPVSAYNAELQKLCENIFSENISVWEKDPASTVPAVHHFIAAMHAPVILIFDSMRYDLFCAIEPFFEKEGWKAKKTAFFLSPLPSDTLTFREAFFPAIDLANGLEFEYQGKRFIFLSAAERDYKREELRSLLQNNPDTALLLSIGLLDEKIHSSTLSTAGIASELVLFCEQTLLPLLSAVSPSRDLVILNDHGFTENPQFAQKSEPRYSHGGNTFYERIVFAAQMAKK